MKLKFGNRDEAKKAWRDHFESRGTAKPPVKARLTVKNATGETAEIMLYDEIGYWGITAKDFADTLNGITAKNINLRINSPGGDVFDGYAMYNALKAHPAAITAKIEGLAASAASYIALAADTVEMAKTSLLMIHNAWGLAIGNANDMTAMAATLGKIDGQIAAIYADKSGKPADQFSTLMDAETWLDPAEAKELGLCDVVTDPGEDDGDDDEADPANSLANPLNARLPADEASRKNITKIAMDRYRLTLAEHT